MNEVNNNKKQKKEVGWGRRKINREEEMLHSQESK